MLGKHFTCELIASPVGHLISSPKQSCKITQPVSSIRTGSQPLIQGQCTSLDTRLWPNTASMAERFTSCAGDSLLPLLLMRELVPQRAEHLVPAYPLPHLEPISSALRVPDPCLSTLTTVLVPWAPSSIPHAMSLVPDLNPVVSIWFVVGFSCLHPAKLIFLKQVYGQVTAQLKSGAFCLLSKLSDTAQRSQSNQTPASLQTPPLKAFLLLLNPLTPSTCPPLCLCSVISIYMASFSLFMEASICKASLYSFLPDGLLTHRTPLSAGICSHCTSCLSSLPLSLNQCESSRYLSTCLNQCSL